MLNVKKIYHENIYGVMGTLIFHILLVGGLLLSELNLNVKIPEKEESILLDMIPPQEKEKLPELKPIDELDKNSGVEQAHQRMQSAGSNLGVNDAPNNAKRKDRFFDASYERDIEDAKKMVADVNKQLSKRIPKVEHQRMVEVTTEGQNPDSIKNVIYSGKSNIHYSLKDRYHVRLPIPVYLAKGGGVVTVDIQVDRSGNVIKAVVNSTKNIADPMLPEYALQAAGGTVFNEKLDAPSVQKGTITYHFVPQ